jgi:hypothetical protein
MNDLAVPASRRLPHGAQASAVVGVIAAACGWLVVGIGPMLTVSYTRLDQLVAVVLGGIVGASVMGMRAVRQRRGVLFSVAAGGLLGAAGMLLGASALVFVHTVATPGLFLAERAAAWALSCGGAALFLGLLAAPHQRWTAERMLIACGGGAIAGVIFTLPGATEVWQAVAFLWFGGVIGIAVAGPELWHAVATVELLPPKGRAASLLAIREWPLHEGSVVTLGEARLACVGGRIALYPPAGGVVSLGRSVRNPTFLEASGTVAVGRSRYYLRLTQAP